MRPGLRSPGYATENVATLVPLCGFNEAGAAQPRIFRVSQHRGPHPQRPESFNEAGAAQPRIYRGKTGLVRSGGMHPLASMRPGLRSPGYGPMLG